MKKILSIVALVLSTTGLQSDASPGKFGLGIIIGEPTGLDAKYFLDSDHALEAAIGWSLSGSNELHIQVDYLFHRYDLLQVEEGQLPFFFGLGGRIKFRENQNDQLGVRFPVGLAYEFAGGPFDVFVEIVPILELIPDTDFDLEGAIGGRFYF